MAEPADTLAFKTLLTHTSAVLLTHGVEVELASVHGVAAHCVEVMANQTGVEPEEAVHLVTPEAVAEIIMKATTDADHAHAGLHAVRPVRIDDREAQVPYELVGHLVMAASQAGKYAGLNEDGAAAAHLSDLTTELGASLVKGGELGTAKLPVSVLDELADLVNAVANRIEAREWSLCPCGEEHGQAEADAGAVPVMRQHVSVARSLRDWAT